MLQNASHPTIWIVGTTLVLLFLLERIFPLRRVTRPLWGRLLINGGLSIITYVTALFFVRPMALGTLQWASLYSVGLLHLFGLTGPSEFLLGFLLLDLSFYYWHRLNHWVSPLWRFHNAHHIDPDLDASTGFRFHFGEVLLSIFFRVIQVAAIGPSLSTFFIYELIFQIETYFHHSNLRMPIPFERIFNFFLVTPRMHGIHHSQRHHETDSNFSVVFSFWDRIHHTYRWNISQSEITIGVPGYYEKKDNQFWNVLFLPFRKQRDYWLESEA